MEQGVGVSAGIGFGPVLKYLRADLSSRLQCAGTPGQEAQKLADAIEELKRENVRLAKKAARQAGEQESGIFEAHNAILEDEEEVLAPIQEQIAAGKSAAQAASDRFRELEEAMGGVKDECIGARAADFRDLGERLVRQILGVDAPSLERLEEDVVLVARDLSPSDTVMLDLVHIKGLVCEEGGPASHTAILAKAMGIPAVVGCKGILARAEQGRQLWLDGDSGEVFLQPTEEEKAALQKRAEKQRRRRETLEVYRKKQTTLTRDGDCVRLSANIAGPQECALAVENGCEGIGLFRSEFLYMNRPDLPGEEEQFRAYVRTLELARGRPVTIRTLDIGGDKAVPAMGLPAEANPFLGYRAIRVCLDREELFRTQLRALYRASAKGRLRIMFPMISRLEELRQAKQIARQTAEELARRGVEIDARVQLGMMMEVPSAAVLADEFAREADFFSIGTNDLTQYTLAVDRGNPLVGPLYSHCQPAGVRLIAGIIRAGARRGIPCCMCGEAAGDSRFIPLLLGLGLKEFSVSSPRIPEIRRLFSRLDGQGCAELARRALKASTEQEIQTLLNAAADAALP